MQPLTRYILFQIPGWLALGLALWWLVGQDWLTSTTAAIVMAVWLVFDMALYPLCRKAFMRGPATGAAAMVGRQAQTSERLAPKGQIIINGERWLATSGDESCIEANQPVKVIGHDKLTLIVRAIELTND